MKKITALFGFLSLFLNFYAQPFQQINWGGEIDGPGGGYPRMAEYSDGRLLLGVDAADGINIYESSNKGETWTHKSIAVPSAGLPANYHVGNVFLYRITDDEWLCAYRKINDHDHYTGDAEDDGINDYSLHVTKSVDGGYTWNYLSEIVHTGSDQPDAGARPGGVWEPFLFHIPQTNELLCFYAKEDARPGPGDTQKLVCKRSYDNGATWTGEIIVAEGAGSRDGMPEVIMTPNNQLLCVFEAHDEINSNSFSIKMVRSDDFGFTWHSRSVVHTSSFSGQYGAGAPYIAQINDGRIFVCYQEQNGSSNPMNYGYVVSEDDGQTWSAGTTIFSGEGWWNSLFVDSENTLYALTSGVKILKAEFPISQDTKNYFKIKAKHSGQYISTSTASNAPDGDNICQKSLSGTDNQLWLIKNAGNGYFYLEPKSAPGKCLEIGGWSTDVGGNAIVWTYNATDNQLWYVKESPEGYYRIVNKHSNKVLDIISASENQDANIFQWDDYIGDNQRFIAEATSGIYTDPFKPYIKRNYVKLLNKNSGKAAEVLGFGFNLGDNVGQWDYLEGINQQWFIHDADSGYIWLEPKVAAGKCLEVDGWSTVNGGNIILWEAFQNPNQLWKPEEVEPGYYKLTNKHSGLVIEVADLSLDNGAEIRQWEWLNTDNHKWSVQYTESEMSNIDPLAPYTDFGNASCSEPLTPAVIADNQTITCVSHTPDVITTETAAEGNGAMFYTWEYFYDGTWQEVPGETGVSFQPPVLEGLAEPPFVVSVRQKVIDACGSNYSNEVTINVIEEAIIPGDVSGSQVLACLNSSINAFADAGNSSGTGTLSYQWQSTVTPDNSQSWQNITGATNLTYTPDNLNEDDSPGIIYYRRALSDECHTAYSDTLTIELQQQELLPGQVSGSFDLVCVADEISTFESVTGAEGNGTIQYQWQSSLDTTNENNWTNIFGIITESHEPTVDFFENPQKKYFRRIATDECGDTAYSNIVYYNMNYVQFQSGEIGSSQVLYCEDEQPELLAETIQATSTHQIDYQWQTSSTPEDAQSWQDINGATQNEYLPDNYSMNSAPDTIYYRLKYFDECEYHYTNHVELVFLHEELNAGEISGNQVVCEDDLPEIIDSQEPAGGTGNVYYQWQYTIDLTCDTCWYDIPGETNETYSPPSDLPVATYYARRMVVDQCDTAYSNLITLEIVICQGLFSTQNNDINIEIRDKTILVNSLSTSIDNIMLTDILGRVIYSSKESKHNCQIPVNLSGVYILKVNDEILKLNIP